MEITRAFYFCTIGCIKSIDAVWCDQIPDLFPKSECFVCTREDTKRFSTKRPYKVGIGQVLRRCFEEIYVALYASSVVGGVAYISIAVNTFGIGRAVFPLAL